MDRKDFKADEDQVFLVDFIGCSVFNESQKKVGVLENFYSNGPQDIMIIKTSSDTLELPFIDEFVLDYDLEKKTIVIKTVEFI